MVDYIVECVADIDRVCVCVLLGLMFIDITSGSVKAFVNKTTLSRVMYDGLVRKAGIILILALAFLIDCLMIFNFQFFNVVAIFYCVYEGLSIIENLGALGVPIPNFLREHLEALKEQTDGGELYE